MGVQMPFVHKDEARNRSYYHRRFPSDVVILTGRFYTKKYPVGISHRDACDLSHQETEAFNQLVADARHRLGLPEGRLEVIRRTIGKGLAERGEALRLARAELDEVDAAVDAKRKEIQFYRTAHDLGIALPNKPRKRVEPEVVVRLWVEKRGQGKRGAPKPQALQAKRSKLARLLSWKAGGSDLDRISAAEVDELLARGDISVITDDDLERYMTALGERGRDHLLDIRALFSTAKKRKLIAVDPGADIKLPYKSVNTREPFDTDEVTRILVRCRDATPYLCWMNRIACYSAAIPSELHMLTNESVREHHGVWSLFLQPPQGERMKTEYRPRIIPLHPAIRDEFVDYARALPPGPLFPDAPRGALNAFLHNECGIARTFYSWRHWVSDQLESIVIDAPQGKIQVAGTDLAPYIMGHTPKTMRAKHYLHPSLKRRWPEVVAAVASLEPADLP